MNRISSGFGLTLLPFMALLIIFSPGCKLSGNSGNADPSLKLLATYMLKIEEPSGITFNQDYTAFWIVDGNSQVIYQTDLKGNIISRLNYSGSDLEGISFDRSDKSLWIVEERLREVVHLDLKGNELKRYRIDIPGKGNKGLEGIAIDDQHNFYLVNEKKPKALLALDKNFRISDQYNIDFVNDLSDLAFDPATKDFFILSDESKAVCIWNRKDGLKKSYSLPQQKCEGIAINPNKKMIYIVNDALNTMYVYEYR